MEDNSIILFSLFHSCMKDLSLSQFPIGRSEQHLTTPSSNPMGAVYSSSVGPNEGDWMEIEGVLSI